MRFLACLLVLCLPPSLLATDYYVSPSGNNSNPGTLVSPWQSPAKVNATAFSPGDGIYFEGGQTFTAGVTLTESGSSGNPILIGSYGVGRATIAPASSSERALSILNGSYIEVKDLVFTGKGRDTHSVEGVLVQNSGSSTKEHFVMTDCEVSGFNPYGLFISATSTGGYNNISITGSAFHHNRDIGLTVQGDWVQHPRPHTNIYVGHCTAYSNWGLSSSPNNMGGMVVMAVKDVLFEFNELYDNGGDPPYGGGVFGIWCWSADHVVMQFNESHHNRQNGSSSDGGGFDLDGATRDSIVQYNYSHDNDGAGVLLAQFGYAYYAGPFINNVVRYNISERDGMRDSYGGITIWGANSTDVIDRSEIYNNVVYTAPATRGGTPCSVFFLDINYKNVTLANNVFIAEPGLRFINCSSGGDNATTVFKGNDYWTPSGGFSLRWNGTVYSSLASWMGVGAAKQEKEGSVFLGKNVDPMLVNAGGGGTLGDPALLGTLSAYQTQAGSPLRDAGLNLSSRLVLTPVPSSQDFYGNSLPKGPSYDIGAHEADYLTPTITSTHTITPTFSITPTPAPATDAVLKLSSHLPLPNPQAGPAFTFSILSTRPVASYTIRIYSSAMRLVAEAEFLPSGQSLRCNAVFVLPELVNGLYFYRLDAEGVDQQKASSAPGRLYVAR